MKLKRTICAILTLVLLLASVLPSLAATQAEQNTADALNSLGLLLGDGTSYALDRGLTRAEGIVLLVRFLGEENEAKKGSYTHSFTDPIPDWAEPYVAYAAAKGLTLGVGDNKFDANGSLTEQMTVTFALRALGYQSGENFNYTRAVDYARGHGMNWTRGDAESFDRGDAVGIFWSALHTTLRNSTKTLATQLIERKVFTAAQLKTAEDIQKNGKPVPSEEPRPSTGGSSTPEEPKPVETPAEKPAPLTWEAFQKLDTQGQSDYYAAFSDPRDFYAWMNAAQEAYNSEHAGGETSGTVDLDKKP